MADSVNKILWKFFGDTKNLDKAMGKTQRGFKQTNKATSAMQGGIGMATKAVGALGVALGGREVLQWAGEAIQMAAAADEVDSKFEAVFGSATDLTSALEEWGNVAGVTTTDAKNLAATFGNLAIAQGVSEEKAQDLALEVATLAGDMASFNDADPQIVFEDLNKALLTTEREGMKKYGIAISEAEVKQRALEIAVADGRDEATQADRAMASYEIAVRQAGKAVGDLERTQDSAANRQRQLNASLREAKEAFGRPLLKAVDDFSRSLDATGGGMEDMAEDSANLLLKLESLTGTMEGVNRVLDEESSTVDKAKGAWNAFIETGAAVIPRLLGVDEALKFNIASAKDLAAASSDVTHTMAYADGVIGGYDSSLQTLEGDLDDATEASFDLEAATDRIAAAMGRARSAFSGDLFRDARIAREVDPLFAGGGGSGQTGYATGGVVPGQRGQAQLAVVHGGERIMTPGQQSGGTTVNVTFSGIVGDPVEVAAQIQDLIELYGRTNGLP